MAIALATNAKWHWIGKIHLGKWKGAVLWGIAFLLITLAKIFLIEDTTFKEIPPTHMISGKQFANQEVVVDDCEYAYCKFLNVTLVVKGVRPFRLHHSKFYNTLIRFDKTEMLNACLLLQGSECLNTNVFIVNNLVRPIGH